MRKWCVFLVAVAMASGVVAEDWYTWRGPTANGVSAETGLNPKASKVLWTKELGFGYSSVSVKDGTLYTMGHNDGQDYIYALNAKTGEPIWEYAYACEPGRFKGPRSTPVLNEGNLYTLNRNGMLFCLNAETGKLRWKTDALAESGNKNSKWGISTSAVIEGELVLLNLGKSGTAVDKTTGNVVWKSKGLQGYATPVVFDFKGKRLVAIFSASGLQIVDAKTGKKVSQFAWKTKYDINGADPLVIGDKIFISSGYDRECALLDFSSGKLKKLWSSEVMKNQFSSCVYRDGYIYGVDGQTKKKGYLRCIDLKDGSEKWNMRIGFGSVIAADGKLIALGERGTLYFAEWTPEKYAEIHQIETGLTQLCWTPPVLANGVVYCRNDKGTLVALSVK